MIDTDKITKDIKNLGNSVVTTVKKVLIGVFTFFTIAISGISLMLFFSGHPVGFAVGIFFGFLALAFLVSAIAIYMSLKESGNESTTNYRKEINSCQKVLDNLKKFMNNQTNRNEYLPIYNSLLESLNNAKLLSKKIDSIRDTMKGREWNINYINEQISNERTKPNSDMRVVSQLEEQRVNIEKLKERERELLNKLSLLKTNFNSIYTKITLLATSDTGRASFDEIETEIKKNLDFELKVSQYEKELDRGVDL